MRARDTRVLVTIVVIVLVAMLGTYGAYRLSDRMGPLVDSEGNEVGGAFRLMDSSDGTMTSTDFRGRWLLMMFGATHCVENKCEATLERLSEALHEVDPKRTQFAPVFVSLDPQRDSSDNLRQFALKFSAKLVAGTGSPDTLAAVAAEYHAPIEKRPDPEWGYAYVMSPRIVIMDPHGRYVGTMESDATEEQMQQRLASLLHPG